MSVRSLWIRPVVLQLLDRADRFLNDAAGDHAESFYRAAVAADLTPYAQIRYGRFLRIKGELTEALTQLMLGWEAARQRSFASCRAAACHEIAEVYREMGRKAEAHQFCQLMNSAILDGLITGDIATVSDEYRLGNARNLIDQNEDSRGHAELLHLAAKGRTPEVRAQAELHIAEFEFCRGRHATARMHLKRSLSLFKADDNAVGVMQVQELTGKILCCRTHLSEADDCFRSALRLAERLSDQRRVERLRDALCRLNNAAGFLAADPLLN